MSQVSKKEKPEAKNTKPGALDWLCIAGAAGLVALALWHLLSLAGYSASDPLLFRRSTGEKLPGPGRRRALGPAFLQRGRAGRLALRSRFCPWPPSWPGRKKTFCGPCGYWPGFLMLTLTGAGLLGFAKTTFSAGGGLLPLGGAAGAALAESC